MVLPLPLLRKRSPLITIDLTSLRGTTGASAGASIIALPLASTTAGGLDVEGVGDGASGAGEVDWPGVGLVGLAVGVGDAVADDGELLGVDDVVGTELG